MNTLVRAFVVALTLTGAAATVFVGNNSASAQPVLTKSSAMPIPTCPPNDPNACGLGQ